MVKRSAKSTLLRSLPDGDEVADLAPAGLRTFFRIMDAW